MFCTVLSSTMEEDCIAGSTTGNPADFLSDFKIDDEELQREKLRNPELFEKISAAAFANFKMALMQKQEQELAANRMDCETSPNPKLTSSQSLSPRRRTTQRLSSASSTSSSTSPPPPPQSATGTMCATTQLAVLEDIERLRAQMMKSDIVTNCFPAHGSGAGMKGDMENGSNPVDLSGAGFSPDTAGTSGTSSGVDEDVVSRLF